MFLKIFSLPTAEDIAKRQLKEAERFALEHESAAEHHDALAAMYRGRVERLRGHLAGAENKPVDLKTGLRVAA